MNTGLILPGIGNSGPEHWQTLWEKIDPSFSRIQQRDWDHPDCEEWAKALETSLTTASTSTILIAHSLACLLVAHWAGKTKLKIKGALLVALPDPEGPNFPKEAMGFSPLPLRALPFPSIVVASSNDPYGSFDFAKSVADAWGSRLVNAGPVGHINASSGLGEWSEGLSLFRQLAA